MLWMNIRRLIPWVLVASYVVLYTLNVRRYVRTSLGGIAIVTADYRVSYGVSTYVFLPAHWLDSRVLRPKYWENYPDSHPEPSQQ